MSVGEVARFLVTMHLEDFVSLYKAPWALSDILDFKIVWERTVERKTKKFN